MDADLSHDPADLPRLIAPALDGADLVLGSRYVPGGGIENWGLERRVLSRAGLRLRAARARRAACATSPAASSAFAPSALRAIDVRDAPTAQGYAFQVELTWRVLSLGLTRRRGADPLPRAPARRVEDVRPHRARGGVAGSGAALRAAAVASALQADAQLPIQCCMKADQLALVQGWPHTVVTLRRWNAARRGGVLGGMGARLAAGHRRCCWRATWFVAATPSPDPPPTATPAITGPATAEDFLFVLAPQRHRARAARAGVRRGLHGRLGAAGRPDGSRPVHARRRSRSSS